MSNNPVSSEPRIFGWKRYEFSLLVWFFLSWGFVFLDRLTISYLSPMVIADFEISDAQFGLISTVTTGCYAVASIIFGAVSDKSGSRKKWLIPFLIGTAIFSALGAATGNFMQLLLTRAAVGFCEGPVLPMIYAMISKESTPSRLGINTGIINTGVSIIAIIFGPSFVALVAASSGWRMSFLLASIPTLVIALIMIATVKNDKILPSESSKTQTEAGEGESIWAKYKACLQNRNILVCFCIGIFAMAGYWTLMTFNALYWDRVGGLDIKLIGFLLSTTGVVGFVQALLIPKLSDMFGRKPVIIICYALSFLAPLTMVTLAGAPNVTIWFYVLFAGIPGCMTPLYMTVIPWESAPERLAGTAGGLILGVSEVVGGAIWPFVAGLISDSSSLETAVGFGCIWFAAAAILGFVLKESNPKEKRLAAKNAKKGQA